MKVFFICNQNQNCSKTAANLFKNRFKTKSAGLYCSRPVTVRQISWADVVIVMEEEQRNEISKHFPKQYLTKRVLSLDIPDIYNYNNAKLVKLLKLKLDDYSAVLT